MAKNDNLKGFVTNVAAAIREKKGTSDLISPQDFADEIASIKSISKCTGHADAEGLRAIGWTDEDIAYYQENGVNWNEEDDEDHKVTDDNKALYGVLTANNISTYRDRIVYLPKIDTSGKISMEGMFSGCTFLVSIPSLNTSSAKTMYNMFSKCYLLTTIPQLDTSNVTNMQYMFSDCYSLTTIPQLDTSNVTRMNYMFRACYSLTTIPQLDTSNVTDMGEMFFACYSLVSIPSLNTSSVTSINSMFSSCPNLTTIPQLDISSVKYASSTFYVCHKLTHLKFKNAKISLELSHANLLTKESLLYLINNEAAENAITIKLTTYAYDRWATDPDVVAALANHPNISLAK